MTFRLFHFFSSSLTIMWTDIQFTRNYGHVQAHGERQFNNREWLRDNISCQFQYYKDRSATFVCYFSLLRMSCSGDSGWETRINLNQIEWEQIYDKIVIEMMRKMMECARDDFKRKSSKKQRFMVILILYLLISN